MNHNLSNVLVLTFYVLNKYKSLNTSLTDVVVTTAQEVLDYVWHSNSTLKPWEVMAKNSDTTMDSYSIYDSLFLRFFQLFIDALWVSHNAPPPIPLISPSLCIHLCPCNLPLQKNNKEQTNKQACLCGSCSVSQCVPQHTFLSTHLYLQMFIAMSHWSGSRPLATATHSILDPQFGLFSAILLLPCAHQGDPAPLEL